jgi:hypothetical protein
MKRFQFSLRQMFWIVTLIAIFVGGRILRWQRDEIVAKEAAVKDYREGQAYIESLRPNYRPETIEQMHQAIDQFWVRHYKEPIPDSH